MKYWGCLLYTSKGVSPRRERQEDADMAEIPMVYRASDELAETFPFKIYTFEVLLTQPLHVHDYFQDVYKRQ